MKTIVLWAFLFGTVRCGEYSDLSKCAADPTDIKFTVKSYRNQTGHWKLQVQLEQRDVQDDVIVSEVDIDQTFTTRCDCCGSVLKVANKTVPPQPAKHIPRGYTKFSEGHYFKSHGGKINFFEAIEVCKQEGAHIAIVDSEDEAMFLRAMWHFPEDYAFSGFQRNEDGKYVTLLNQSLSDIPYQKWHHGKKYGDAGRDCGYIYRDLTIHDSHCTYQFPFFCELE